MLAETSFATVIVLSVGVSLSVFSIVISLEEDDSLTQKKIDDVKRMINNGTIKYIYTKDNTTNDTVQKLLDTYKKVELIKINDMFSNDGGVTNSNENYLTIMNDNIDLIKKELYK